MSARKKVLRDAEQPERIYLDRISSGPDTGRVWCENDDPAGTGNPWTEYIRSDLVAETEGELVTLVNHGDGWHEPRKGKTYNVDDRVVTVRIPTKASTETCDNPECVNGRVRVVLEHTHGSVRMGTDPCPDCAGKKAEPVRIPTETDDA